MKRTNLVLSLVVVCTTKDKQYYRTRKKQNINKGGKPVAIQELKSGIYSVGVRDWSRRLFDELIPLPDGTSYNSYLLKGTEKIALIDSVDTSKGEELLANLKTLGLTHIDYVICNHAEQDHSGSIPAVLGAYPMAKVVTNEKCRGFLQDLMHIPTERFITINDGETLSLGNWTLEFVFTPWVHWPETMGTFLREEGIFFSCDFFGSHMATSHLFVHDEHKVVADAKRYFAEIMMPFRSFIRKNIVRVEQLGVKMIAPSHGPVYDKPALIIDAYKDWVSDRVTNTVVLAYVSMHGSTEKMAYHLTDALIQKGIEVKVFNLTHTDSGDLAMALVDAATVVLGSSTVLGGPHPAAVYAATLLNALKPKVKFASIFGSYGWGGRTVEVITANISNLKVELIEPVLHKGDPTGTEFSKLDQMADAIAERHKTLG